MVTKFFFQYGTCSRLHNTVLFCSLHWSWYCIISGSTSSLLINHCSFNKLTVFRVGKKVDVRVHRIHLSVVACGDRAEEVLVLLKSAVIMTTSTPLVLHIFAERELHTFFTQQVRIVVQYACPAGRIWCLSIYDFVCLSISAHLAPWACVFSSKSGTFKIKHPFQIL